MAYKVNIDNCIGCEDCYYACKVNAVEITRAYVYGVYNRNLAKILSDDCIEAGDCAKVCPADAIVDSNGGIPSQGGGDTGVIIVGGGSGAPIGAGSMIDLENYISPSELDFGPTPCPPFYNGKFYDNSADLMLDIFLKMQKNNLD